MTYAQTTAGAHMPKYPSTDDIMRDLLALSSPVEAQQTPARPDTPSTPSEAPQKPVRRKLGTSQARQAHERWTGSREAQREARARAEEWLQALRAWQVMPRQELVSNRSTHSSGGGIKFIVGQYTQGGSSIAAIQFNEISTPIGWVSESAVARLCNADELLGRIRRGSGLATLSQAGGGWHQHREQAQAYAVALLEMAVILGDERAERALTTLKNC